MSTHLLLVFSLLGTILLSSCQKEKTEVVYTTISLSDTASINDILFVSPDTGYAAMGKVFEAGTLWKTTDAGNTWDTITTSKWGVQSLAYSQNTLISHDAIIHFYNYKNDQLISKNQSLEWDNIWRDLDFINPNNIVIVGNTNFHLGKIWILDKNGYAVHKHEYEHEIQEVLFVADSTLYAVGYGIVLKSIDNGYTFEPYAELKGDFFRSISFPTQNTGYIVGEYGTIFKTTDYGKSWKKLATGNTLLNKKNRLKKVFFTSESTGYITGNAGLFWITVDGGNNWKKVTNLPNSDYESISIMNNKAYLGNNDGQIIVVDL